MSDLLKRTLSELSDRATQSQEGRPAIAYVLVEGKRMLRMWGPDGCYTQPTPADCEYIAAATEAVPMLLGALEIDQPWPVADVLEKLAEAADILLHEYNYDGTGWEIISGCVERARRQAQKLRRAGVGATAERVVSWQEPTNH